MHENYKASETGTEEEAENASSIIYVEINEVKLVCNHVITCANPCPFIAFGHLFIFLPFFSLAYVIVLKAS